MPRPSDRFVFAAALFAATLLTRLPFATEHLWGWDSVLYARAMESFDPVAQRPHAPGALYYVLLARAVEALAGDANRALVLISAVAAAVAVALLYLLGVTLYDEFTGRVSALFLASAVTFWAYGAVAYPYTLLALLTIGVALLLWRALERPGPRLLLASAAWGLAIGFRSDLALLIAPLWLLVAWRTSPRIALAGAVVTGALVGGWILATASQMGGVDRFWLAVREQSDYLERTSSVFGRGAGAVATNLYELARFLGRGLYFLAVPFAALLLSRGALGVELARPPRALFLALWLAAPLGVYVLYHVGDYGHVFSVLPGCCVAAARGALALGSAARAIARSVTAPRVATAVALANALLFLATDTPLSAADLVRRDRSLVEKVAYLRALDAGAYVVSAYDAVLVEHYLGDPRHVLLRYDVLEGATRRLPASCAQPPGCRVVVWDDVLRPEGALWEVVALPSGARLRLARAVAPVTVAMAGLTVRLVD